jgi:hypothetical protein
VPVLTNISRDGNHVQFNFAAQQGRSYQVYYRDDLNTGSWQPLGAPVSSNDGIITIDDTTDSAQRFYQIQILP